MTQSRSWPVVGQRVINKRALVDACIVPAHSSGVVTKPNEDGWTHVLFNVRGSQRNVRVLLHEIEPAPPADRKAASP